MDKFKIWLKSAIIRAIKTWAQAFLALVPTTAVTIGGVNWLLVISGATLAAILSIVTSIAGLPEVDQMTYAPRFDIEVDRSDNAPIHEEEE